MVNCARRSGLFMTSRATQVFLLLFWFVAVSRAGTLTGTFAPVASGSNVDLTAVGKLDWAHWGLYTDTSMNRKASVSPQISNFTLLGDSGDYLAAYQYSDNANSYSWQDGTPVSVVSHTTTGVWAYGSPIAPGAGFEISVPADTTQKTLEVFLGAYAAKGKFTASLSDNSAPAFTNTMAGTVDNAGNGPGGVFSITYAADSTNQTLTVQWTLEITRGTGGNVTLQAAALTAPGADNPPYALITSPSNNAAFPEPATITIAAAAQDFDGNVTNVAFYAGTNLLEMTASGPYSFTWTNAPRGKYLLTAAATDNSGVTSLSHPVEVFVYGAGGSQSNSIAQPPAEPSSVDLMIEGTADWTHWGLATNSMFDHKNSVSGQISNFAALGADPVQSYGDNYTGFSWEDGTPTPAASGTTTGVFITGEGDGFELTAPADTSPRQLRIYVGGYGVQAEFLAYLGDLSAPPFDDMTVSNVYNNSYAVYTINYAAATNSQQLIIIYRSRQLFDQAYGNVTLQAATLQSYAPMPVEIQNPQLTADGFIFSFLTQTNRIYTVQSTPSLNPASWQPLQSYPGNGAVITATNQTLTDSNSFFRVLTQ